MDRVFKQGYMIKKAVGLTYINVG